MFKQKVILLVAAFSLILLLLPVTGIAATNAQLYLTPSSVNVTPGTDVNYTITMNSGGNSVLAWKATLTYPTNIFSSASVSTAAGSNFTSLPAADTASGGTIKLARYALSASSASGAVANITLHAANVGSGSVSFAHICSSTSDASACSTVTDSTGANLLASITGASASVANAAAGGGTSGGSTGSTAQAGSTKAGQKAAAVATTVPAAAAAVTTQSTTMAPAKAVYISKDGKKYNTKVLITVVDQKAKVVMGAKVTLAGISVATSKSGQVVMTGIPPGTARGSINYKGYNKNISVVIKSTIITGSSSQSEKFSIVVARPSILLPMLMFALGISLTSGLIICLVWQKVNRPLSTKT